MWGFYSTKNRKREQIDVQARCEPGTQLFQTSSAEDATVEKSDDYNARELPTGFQI